CLPQSGYLCSNDSRIHFGLPPNTKVESIEVRWADGVPEQSGEVFSGPAVNQHVVLRQGAGKEPEVQP
ncbi:MAG: ASPIC/UnbV domain-containing protein, partial [Planctomycetaceae bacterium]